MLQLVAEEIRDIIWDGGFKQLCHECGHKKLPTQWQEIHILLLALYESLLHKAVLNFNSTVEEVSATNYKKFWEWMGKIASESNVHENSQFWSRMLSFLTGYFAYFVAVRSGNWVLRNSAMKSLTPLFSAYNHYKYEELAGVAIKDSLTIPEDLLKYFLTGGWTVSNKARPHHNLALDEAHESMINLRLKTITSRPSHFRTVEMSNFMSYLDIVVRGMEGHLYRHKEKEPAAYRKRYVCQRASKMQQMLKDTPVFEQHEAHSCLSNLISPGKPLDSKSIFELLHIAQIRGKRFETYVQNHILSSSGKQRRKRPRKLATFSRRASTTSEGKRRVEELTTIAKNAMEILQANGITAQTSPYPLAIAESDGTIRSSAKSKFLETLIKCLDFQQVVTTSCSLFNNSPDLCVTIDMLYFIHMPPPASVVTFSDYFEQLWRQTVTKYAIQNHAAHVYLVFDKPNYLPPPRAIVHAKRGKRGDSALSPVPNPTVANDAVIPHTTKYSSMLANSPTFKQQLLDYITNKFRDKGIAVTREYSFKITIDSPTLSSVLTIRDGTTSTEVSNEHGEADYAIWHHCIRESSHNIVVVSSDTDTWVYGLGLCGQGHLEGKHVIVRRGNMDSYVDVTAAALMLSEHPKLAGISFPVLSLVTLYVLTGCDYVSAFYRCSKTLFVETLMKNKGFICCNDPLLKTIGNHFQFINEEVWVKLVTTVYYTKFKQFFRSRSVEETFDIVTRHSDSPEAKRMLQAVQFDPSRLCATSRSHLQIWHEFMRKVTFHVPKVTKYHEHKLLPSYEALILHCKRANYVIHLSMSAPWTHSPFLFCHEQFGWHVTEDSQTVHVSWDDSTEDSDNLDNESLSNSVSDQSVLPPQMQNFKS